MNKQFFLGIVLGAIVATLTYFALGSIPITRAASHPAIPTVNKKLNAKYLNGFQAHDFVNVHSDINAHSLDGLGVDDFVKSHSDVMDGLVKAAINVDCRSDDETNSQVYFNKLSSSSDVYVTSDHNLPPKCTIEMGQDMRERIVLSQYPEIGYCLVNASASGTSIEVTEFAVDMQQHPCNDGEFTALIFVY